MLKALLVLLATVASVAVFAVKMRSLVALLLKGRKEMLWDRPMERFGNVVRYVFLHKKVMEDPRAGLMHMWFFYGFVVLGAGHTEHARTERRGRGLNGRAEPLRRA